MQVCVCREGEVAIIMFYPFLFCSNKLSKRIINNEYTLDIDPISIINHLSDIYHSF